MHRPCELIVEVAIRPTLGCDNFVPHDFGFVMLLPVNYNSRATLLEGAEMAQSAKRIKKIKQFSLSEMNAEGMDNYWWVSKKRLGYYLNANEMESEGPNNTICEALNAAGQFAGGNVEIKTNVSLDELFEILASYAFKVLLYNSDYLSINDAEVDVKALTKVLEWYSAVQAKPSGPTSPNERSCS